MSSAQHIKMSYQAEPTALKFHADRSLVRGLMGPRNSGKSVASCWEMILKANAQKVRHGVRRSRWVAIRNTFPMLKSTTIKTWADWMPDEIAPINWGSPITSRAQYTLREDGSKVDLEIMFLALDRPKDVKKLKSLECTAAWINEAVEIPEKALDMLLLSVGRWPSAQMGGCSWSGVIMDTNPPDDDHWWYNLFEVELPRGYAIYKQPPALIWGKDGNLHPNPKAENIDNLELGYDYYIRASEGKDRSWINVMICGEYGAIKEGRPVYPEYSDHLHCAKEELVPFRGIPLVLGFDFGLNPSAAFMQLAPIGQLRIIDEITTEEMGIRQMAQDVLLPKLNSTEYSGLSIQAWGDPSGSIRVQTDKKTCYDILAEAGVRARPTNTNDFIARREALAKYMLRRIGDESGFLLSPKCKVIRKGLISGYQFERVQVVGQERYKDKPTKNRFSHIIEATQYGAQGLSPRHEPHSRARPRAKRVVVSNPLGWT